MHLISTQRPSHDAPFVHIGLRSRTASFGLVEAVVGISIMGVSFLILFGLAIVALRLSTDASLKIQSSLLLQEGAEAVRMMRSVNGGWATYFYDGVANNQERCLLNAGNNFSAGIAALFSGVTHREHWAIAPTAHAQAIQELQVEATDVGYAQDTNATGYINVRSDNGDVFVAGPTGGSLYHGYTAGVYVITRPVLRFDTSALPDTAVIDAVYLEIYGTTIAAAGAPAFTVTQWTDAEDGIEAEDYQKYTSLNDPQTYGSATPNVGITTVTLNNNSIVNKNGITGMMLRATNELNALQPPTQFLYFTFDAITDATRTKPKLTVRYRDTNISQLPANCEVAVGGKQFYRTITIGPVCRDGDNNISTAGSTCSLQDDDPNSRRVTINVYWAQRETKEVETLETYIINR